MAKPQSIWTSEWNIGKAADLSTLLQYARKHSKELHRQISELWRKIEQSLEYDVVSVVIVVMSGVVCRKMYTLEESTRIYPCADCVQNIRTEYERKYMSINFVHMNTFMIKCM